MRHGFTQGFLKLGIPLGTREVCMPKRPSSQLCKDRFEYLTGSEEGIGENYNTYIMYSLTPYYP